MATGFPQPTNFANGDVLAASSMNDITGTLNLLGNVVLNSQTGTTYTLASTDSAKLVSLSNASAITLTVPPNSTWAAPVGTQVILYQAGAGQVTVAAGSGVTIRSNGAKLKLNGQYAVASLIKIATDEWILAGNTAA